MKRDCAVTDIFTISHILNNNDAIIVCPDFHADRQCTVRLCYVPTISLPRQSRAQTRQQIQNGKSHR